MFSVGEYVVKPNTGICKIVEIVYMSLIGDDKKQYYALDPLGDAKSRLFVSVEADRKRLRPVMTRAEARAFLDSIADIEEIYVPSDKLREQQYKEAFRSNEAKDLAGVIKNLHKRAQIRIAQGKKITSTDEKYFRQAEKALYSELAFSLEDDPKNIQRIVMENIAI